MGQQVLTTERWGRVPKERRDNLRYRRWLRGKANANKRVREALIDACRHDLLFYINSFVFTYDPETESGEIPMITWPAQERALATITGCIRERQDLLIQKSRRQGGSWLSLLAMEHPWHFHRSRQFLMISRDANMVDGPTPDSLFWKIDFMHRYLPEWLMPKGYQPGKHRLKMYYENPVGGGTMTGQATTAKAGVGGRATAIFFDEFSRVDEAEEVLNSTADTSRCRIFNSTHTGTGTAFYRLSQRENIKKLYLHWSENPYCNRGLYRHSPELGRVEALDKTYQFPHDYNFVMDGTPAAGPFPGIRSPWYDKECERRGNSRAIAMDLDINPSGSMSQFFEPMLIRRLIKESCTEPYWQGDIQCEPGTGKHGVLVAVRGYLKLWVHLDYRNLPLPMPVVIGWDVGAGTGATPTCGCGWNARTGEKVLEYANAHIDPKMAGTLAVALARIFKDQEGNPARLIWEVPGPGEAFGLAVLETGFRSIYKHTADHPVTMTREVSNRPGWTNNKKTQLLLLEDYCSALSTGQCTNRSELALKECLAFRYSPTGDVEHAEIASEGDPSGARVNHGDRVIADALAWKECKGRVVSLTKKEPQRPLHPTDLAWRRKYWEDRWREEEEGA